MLQYIVPNGPVSLRPGQSRTLLLKNNGASAVVAMVSQPQPPFQLQLDSKAWTAMQQPSYVAAQLPANSALQITVRLDASTEEALATGLQDCLIVVLGETPLLVPLLTTCHQPSEPSSHPSAPGCTPGSTPGCPSLHQACRRFLLQLGQQLGRTLPLPQELLRGTAADHPPDPLDSPILTSAAAASPWPGPAAAAAAGSGAGSRAGADQSSCTGGPLNPRPRDQHPPGIQQPGSRGPELKASSSSQPAAGDLPTLPQAGAAGPATPTLPPDCFSDPQAVDGCEADEDAWSQPLVVTSRIVVKGRTAYAIPAAGPIPPHIAAILEADDDDSESGPASAHVPPAASGGPADESADRGVSDSQPAEYQARLRPSSSQASSSQAPATVSAGREQGREMTFCIGGKYYNARGQEVGCGSEAGLAPLLPPATNIGASAQALDPPLPRPGLLTSSSRPAIHPEQQQQQQQPSRTLLQSLSDLAAGVATGWVGGGPGSQELGQGQAGEGTTALQAARAAALVAAVRELGLTDLPPPRPSASPAASAAAAAAGGTGAGGVVGRAPRRQGSSAGAAEQRQGQSPADLGQQHRPSLAPPWPTLGAQPATSTTQPQQDRLASLGPRPGLRQQGGGRQPLPGHLLAAAGEGLGPLPPAHPTSLPAAAAAAAGGAEGFGSTGNAGDTGSRLEKNGSTSFGASSWSALGGSRAPAAASPDRICRSAEASSRSSASAGGGHSNGLRAGMAASTCGRGVGPQAPPRSPPSPLNLHEPMLSSCGTWQQTPSALVDRASHPAAAPCGSLKRPTQLQPLRRSAVPAAALAPGAAGGLGGPGGAGCAPGRGEGQEDDDSDLQQELEARLQRSINSSAGGQEAGGVGQGGRGGGGAHRSAQGVRAQPLHSSGEASKRLLSQRQAAGKGRPQGRGGQGGSQGSGLGTEPLHGGRQQQQQPQQHGQQQGRFTGGGLEEEEEQEEEEEEEGFEARLAQDIASQLAAMASSGGQGGGGKNSWALSQADGAGNAGLGYPWKSSASSGQGGGQTLPLHRMPKMPAAANTKATSAKLL